jgi:CheY-like chemotaxis protein
LLSRIIRDAGSSIGRLQDFARRRHDRPVERVDLNAVIQQSVEIAKSTLEERNFLLGRSIQVEMEIPKLLPIMADPAELRQIFLNLLLNAQDAMPAGGAIRIAGRADDQTIVISMEDEGQGIPQEYLDRIFDPFFTTKGERGTGLGLSIAYHAMARLGGNITAANRPEGGAVFALRFPVARGEPLRNTPHRSPTIRPRRVMVIDDDPDNLRALTMLLEAKGHSVVATNSGSEALEQLMRGNCLVEVVLCDLGMPLINGWEVARQAKALETPPAFYLVTGWGQEIAAEDPRRHLVDGVLAKPIEPEFLDHILEKASRDNSSARKPGALLATNPPVS